MKVKVSCSVLHMVNFGCYQLNSCGFNYYEVGMNKFI